MNEAVTHEDSRSVKQDPTEAIPDQKGLESFEALYDRYAASIYRYLLSRTGDVEAAKDLTSQTFLTAIEAYPRYRDRGQASAWLFSIARSRYIDHIRRSARQRRIEQARAADFTPDALSQVVETERIGALRARIRALTEGDQELLRLRFVADLSFSDIAQVLNRKEDAVKKALYRLLARLQRQMEQDDE